MSKSPKALIILDGFGCRDEVKGNAVAQAKNRISIVFGRNSRIAICWLLGKR